MSEPKSYTQFDAVGAVSAVGAPMPEVGTWYTDRAGYRYVVISVEVCRMVKLRTEFHGIVMHSVDERGLTCLGKIPFSQVLRRGDTIVSASGIPRVLERRDVLDDGAATWRTIATNGAGECYFSEEQLNDPILQFALMNPRHDFGQGLRIGDVVSRMHEVVGIIVNVTMNDFYIRNSSGVVVAHPKDTWERGWRRQPPEIFDVNAFCEIGDEFVIAGEVGNVRLTKSQNTAMFFTRTIDGTMFVLSADKFRASRPTLVRAAVADRLVVKALIDVPEKEPADADVILRLWRGHQCPKCHGFATAPYEGLFTYEPSKCARKGGCLADKEPTISTPDAHVENADIINVVAHNEPRWFVRALGAVNVYATRELALEAWRNHILQEGNKK